MMKNISIWAKANPVASRIIIAISYLLALLNAVCLGTLCFLYNLGYSKWALGLLAALFFTIYFFYPQKGIKKGWFQHSYKRQKLHDFGLILSCSMVIVLGINNIFIQMDRNNYLTEPKATFIVNKITPEEESKNRKSLRSAFKEKKKQLRKQIKQELRELKKKVKRKAEQGNGTGLRILLIFLTVFAAIILALIIALLACGIGCSGNGALATVVLLLGWAGIIFLSIITIRSILKKVGRGKEDV